MAFGFSGFQSINFIQSGPDTKTCFRVRRLGIECRRGQESTPLEGVPGWQGLQRLDDAAEQLKWAWGLDMKYPKYYPVDTDMSLMRSKDGLRSAKRKDKLRSNLKLNMEV